MKLLNLNFRRKGKCKYSNSCEHYYSASFTCTHMGGSYCGRYRKLTKKGSTQNDA